ncbi:MAG: hypothetical protein IT581_19725 [Verrucomicrobiales bacterium]|nr:hypothetical protein [Verrucomicrobiales bacterium]
MTSRPSLAQYSGDNRRAGLGLAAILLGVFTFGIASLTSVHAGDAPKPKTWIWFEAEPDGTTPGNEAGLSNGRMVWVQPKGKLSRTLRVPQDGTYTLWIRKFWNPQGIRWSVGSGSAWTDAAELSLSDLQMLDGDASRRVGWAAVGLAKLKTGDQEFQLEVLDGDTNTTAYDCFVLTASDFMPRGIARPDEILTAQRPGWFAFQPGTDRFEPSPIDLRSLNESAAGDGGRIRRNGDGFAHDRTGEPVRFWGVNVGMERVRLGRDEAVRFARGLAKRGVNLVRLHGAIYATQGTNFGRVDTRRIRQVQDFIEVLKHEGIYTSLSIYFPLWVEFDATTPAFAGYNGGHPFALLYFHEEFQRHYRQWWTALLQTPNPSTGRALRDEPAVAFLEMINEDSTLFWTFNPDQGSKGNLPDPQREFLERRFAQWALKQHPGLDLRQFVAQSWTNTVSAQDNLADGRLGFRGLWDIANRRTRRDQDTARFLADLMTTFHRQTYDFLKKDLGYPGLVYCSNWKTASPTYLDPIDKHANLVGDFLDRHGYFEGTHEGRNATWNVEANQSYDDRSALLLRNAKGIEQAPDNPLFDLDYDGRPSMVSEINWSLPNRFRADMIPMGAAYGGLLGTDAIVWFVANATEWDSLPGKFSTQTPVVAGQFPAAALIFRQGLIQTGPASADLELSIGDLYSLKGIPVRLSQNLDSLRSADVPRDIASTEETVMNPLALLAGPIRLNFVTNNAAAPRATDLAQTIRPDHKQATSLTKELEWDWGLGLLTLSSPKAQGMTGFLRSAGSRSLPDVTIESTMEYGSILLVPLDRLPLRESRSLLLQVASEEEPFDWKTEPATGKRRITSRGSAPLLVREFNGRVRLKPSAHNLKFTATPLDYQGMPAGPAFAAEDGIQLRPDIPYYWVHTADR